MSGDVQRLHAMFAAACFGESADGVASGRASAAELRAYLARHGVVGEDADAILAAPRRLGLYRQLVRHNVVNVVRTMLERTRVRLEVRAPGVFDRTVELFMAERGPRTPHLRDVPNEFLAWAAPRWRKDERLAQWPWLSDYAELELVEFTIGVAPRPAPPPPLADVAPDRSLVFADPRVMVRLAWAVHELAADDTAAAPLEREVHLLAYRDAEHRVRFLDLSPVAAAILERLFAGSPLAKAMVEACEASGQALDNAVLAGAARLLADLGERGVLLGARE